MQIELTRFANKAAIEAGLIFGAESRPGFADPGHVEENRIARVPANFNLWLNFTHDLDQARQKRPVPPHFSPDREPFITEMPALAVDLPRHQVFRPGLH